MIARLPFLRGFSRYSSLNLLSALFLPVCQIVLCFSHVLKYIQGFRENQSRYPEILPEVRRIGYAWYSTSRYLRCFLSVQNAKHLLLPVDGVLHVWKTFKSKRKTVLIQSKAFSASSVPNSIWDGGELMLLIQPLMNKRPGKEFQGDQDLFRIKNL
jgi:hypothetical protein